MVFLLPVPVIFTYRLKFRDTQGKNYVERLVYSEDGYLAVMGALGDLTVLSPVGKEVFRWPKKIKSKSDYVRYILGPNKVQAVEAWGNKIIASTMEEIWIFERGKRTAKIKITPSTVTAIGTDGKNFMLCKLGTCFLFTGEGKFAYSVMIGMSEGKVKAVFPHGDEWVAISEKHFLLIRKEEVSFLQVPFRRFSAFRPHCNDIVIGEYSAGSERGIAALRVEGGEVKVVRKWPSTVPKNPSPNASFTRDCRFASVVAKGTMYIFDLERGSRSVWKLKMPHRLSIAWHDHLLALGVEDKVTVLDGLGVTQEAGSLLVFPEN